MAYQVYFADLTEENRSLVLALLRLKEESGKLEPGEEELLAKLAGVASVVRKRGSIDLKLVDEAGGARLALQRAVGNGVTVGNQQVHLPESADTPWAQSLLEVLAGIEAFRQRMPEVEAGLPREG